MNNDLEDQVNEHVIITWLLIYRDARQEVNEH